jgi:hypothetical protein
MSANSQHVTPHETSGQTIFFAMALAFGVVLVAILVAFFLPVAAGIGLSFATLAVVLAAFGVFMGRVLGDGH